MHRPGMTLLASHHNSQHNSQRNSHRSVWLRAMVLGVHDGLMGAASFTIGIARQSHGRLIQWI